MTNGERVSGCVSGLQIPLPVLSLDGDLDLALKVSLFRPPLKSRSTKVLERCRVLFSSRSFPFCFFSFF